MTLFIITVLALALWAYIDYNSTKATGRWAWAGVKGVGNDIQAAKFHMQEKQVANPTRQQDIVDTLNDVVLDTAAYHKSSRARRIDAHTSMHDAIKLLDK